ncbi:MAG TPA: aminotransferase class I/II-fold pyridoxal phosphate-dependent enzyme [Candidatus Limnocylindrales bacterium]|jgi:cystathionine beta-lyase/cystathionine gamma-synthase|nr:aminotransferase class I/II-fold pyridoxal phosphate-dependent enzyme [Candidatus Limnocylindrales bacterium]
MPDRESPPPREALPRDAAPLGFSTRAIRAAHRLPRVDQRPTSVPIYQTITFSSEDAAELGAVLTGQQPGYAYSRIDNPTVAAFAAAIAEIEGAEAGFAFATGMAAIHAALVAVVSAGDRIVASHALYGTTRSLIGDVLGRLGVHSDFVDITDLAAVEAALAAEPARILYAETIANPTIVVADHAALAEIAHRHGALYVVDNTFASPYLCRPVELGADLVVESATKYLAGHSDVLAGVVSGRADLIDSVRGLQVDTGASLAPHSAFLALRGLSTLAIRMERHSATAAALAAWLERQAGVTRVYHPSLVSHPQALVAGRQLAAGGGMLAFELAGGREAGAAFIDALTIPELTASLGSVFTMVVHPPSTTHRQLDDAALAQSGIGTGLLRCSVGLEDVEDLIADFKHGLTAARAMTGSDEPASEPAASLA